MALPRWTALKPGDLIDIVAPASGSSKKEFRDSIKFVRNFGLRPRVQPRMFGNDLLCSNTDEVRFKQLKKALFARDSKAVWCLRGGYGSARLLPLLNKLRPPKSCKLFIGYSDITALHVLLNQKWKWPTVHGTMLEELGRGEGGRRELNDFRNIIYGLEKSIEHAGLVPMNKWARKKETVTGKVIGGNLAILNATLGTPWQFKTKGKILCLEDIGERGYRIDRMLVQMLAADVFKGVKAVIFGDFVGGEENKEDDVVYLWKEVQKKFAKDMDVPVLKGMSFGHGPFQRPVPFNTKAELHLGRYPSLNIRHN